MAHPQEKRRYLRVGEDDEISYSIISPFPPEQARRSTRNLTSDLSTGGIRFRTDGFIPPKSVLKVQLTMKHERKAVEAIVRVAWVREVFGDERYELGAEFVSISQESLRFLRAYLGRRL